MYLEDSFRYFYLRAVRTEEMAFIILFIDVRFEYMNLFSNLINTFYIP